MSLLQTGDTHMTEAQKPKRASRRAATSPAQPRAAGKAPSKQECLGNLLVRDEGATLDQMIAVAGWLPQTTRAAMTGLRKKGYVIDSDKVDGVRTYRGWHRNERHRRRDSRAAQARQGRAPAALARGL